MSSPQANIPSDDINEEPRLASPPPERKTWNVARFFKWAFILFLVFVFLCAVVVRNQFLLEAPGRLFIGWLGYGGKAVSVFHLRPLDLVLWIVGLIALGGIAHYFIIRIVHGRGIVPPWRPRHTAISLALLSHPHSSSREMNEYVLLYAGQEFADEKGPIAVSPVVVMESSTLDEIIKSAHADE